MKKLQRIANKRGYQVCWRCTSERGQYAYLVEVSRGIDIFAQGYGSSLELAAIACLDDWEKSASVPTHPAII